MQNTKLLILMVVVLSGCATFGTKTLYKADATITPKKIGFTKLDGNKIVNKIKPITDSVFTSSFVQSFKKYGVTDIIPFETEQPFDAPDQSTIAALCKDNNLDALVVSRLKFINVALSAAFIPLGKSWDTEVKMKVFDRNGSLLLTVSHNTANGNSYPGLPVAVNTIYDGTKGAIKRIGKEFKLGK